MCCSPLGRKELDTTERRTELNLAGKFREILFENSQISSK